MDQHVEHGSIERALFIEAAPDVVFEVVSRPEHIREWWGAETAVEPAAGSTGSLTWRDDATGRVDVVSITIVEVDRPHRFVFRWVQPSGEEATEANSLLVTFDLTPSGSGTMLRMTETGFREVGWEVAVLEEAYRDHVSGWDHYLPRIATRASSVVSSS